MRRLVGVALCVALAGCLDFSRDAYYVIAHDDDEALAQSLLRVMHDGDRDATAVLLPGVASASDDIWAQMQETMASADLPAAYLVGAHTYYSNDGRASTLVYEGPRQGGYFVAEVRMSNGAITNATFWRNDRTVAERNRLLAQPISLSRLLVLLLGVGSFAYSLLTFGAVLRSNVSARRRWAVASLIGFAVLSVNWTTGATSLEVASFRLPVLLIGRSGPDAPWVFGVLFPLGALLANLRLKRARRAASATQPDAMHHDEDNPVAL